MSFELKGYEKDNMSMKSIALYYFLGSGALILCVVLVSFYFSIEKENYYRKNVMQIESESTIEYKRFEKEFLQSYNLIDKENKIYSIPIDEAIKMVEKKYSGNTQR